MVGLEARPINPFHNLRVSRRLMSDCLLLTAP